MQGRKNFSSNFLVPLFAEARWRDDQDAPLAFGPFLREDQARLDGLAQANFVRQQRTPRQRGAEGEQRGFDLVGVQIDLGVNERAGELLDAIGRASLGAAHVRNTSHGAASG